MKPSTLPTICTTALVAMLAAGTSHWWSVHQFMAMIDSTTPIVPPAAVPAPIATPRVLAQNTPKPSATTNTSSADNSPQQKAFYEALIEKLARMENQNRDLLDQLAETNRDLMKLEFRVDTHSESFRPLPVSEDQPFSSLDSNVGVLPPRAQPVGQPSYE